METSAAAATAGPTWPFHYRGMRRSLRRLEALALGERFGDSRDSEEATDALFQFFQDAFHLKDWIKKDGTTAEEAGTTLECDLFCRGDYRGMPHSHALGPVVMRLCAEMCNGAKHHKLNDSARFGMAGVDHEHVMVRPGAAGGQGSAGQALPPLHSWSLFADRHHFDGLRACRDIVAEWDRWLASHGLAVQGVDG